MKQAITMHILCQKLLVKEPLQLFIDNLYFPKSVRFSSRGRPIEIQTIGCIFFVCVFAGIRF